MSKVKTFKCKECGKVFNRYMGYKANKRQYSWWRRAYKSYCTELHKDVWCKEVGVRRCEDCVFFLNRKEYLEGAGNVEYKDCAKSEFDLRDCESYKRKWYLFWRSK